MPNSSRQEIEESFENVDTQKNKFLTFKLGKEFYAIEIMNVTEIIGLEKITEVPDTSKYVMGIINLRGQIIPVIDVRLRFGLESKDYTDRTCIIVVKLDDMDTGLIVDEVSEVLDIPENQIDNPPNRGNKKNRFIKGMGKVNKSVKMILNLDKLLNDDEKDEVKAVAEEEED
mgnify:FL=1